MSLLSVYLVVSTIIVLFGFVIWSKKGFTNFLIKTALLGVGIVGVICCTARFNLLALVGH